MWLLIAFIAVPMIEIYLFITVGGAIGTWPTLGIVLITAIIGSTLVRSQGAREMQKLRGSFSELQDPTEPLANGAMILFSGALLLTPGFFTDAVGFALLIPPVRAAVFQYLKSRMNVTTFQMGPDPHQPRKHNDSVIDGEFEEVKTSNPDRPSGWTKLDG